MQSVYKYASMYICMYDFPDDNKQEILELFNIFSQCIFVIEILDSLNKIFQEYFLNSPIFKLVAIQKSINKIFEKQLQRNPFLS